jgi:hypothetical protein
MTEMLHVWIGGEEASLRNGVVADATSAAPIVNCKCAKRGDRVPLTQPADDRIRKEIGRGERIRTSGLLVPNQAL